MTLQGHIRSILYTNKADAWSVAMLDTEGGAKYKLVGIMPGLQKGMRVEVEGEPGADKLGPCFNIKRFEEQRPESIEGIYNYLASGLIKHIGPVHARKIVEAFGVDTWKVLDDQPERLRDIRGIGAKRIESIIKSAREQKPMRKIYSWLKNYDLPNGLAAKIYRTYGDQSIAKLEENPYRLADDIKGVGFKKSDDVARKLGLPTDSPARITSGIRAYLEDRAAEGDTYADKEILIADVSSEDYLDIDMNAVRTNFSSWEFMHTCIEDDGLIFLPAHYYAEKNVARRLAAILHYGRTYKWTEADFRTIEHNTGITYSIQQRLAINTALNSKAMILTGGPGTGKTTTTNSIISEFERRGMKVLLTAPTGRAAKRMTESSGREAKTIHRLLEFGQDGFQRNADNPLKGDVLIVDESSMIDTQLMRDLLEAVPDRMRVVLVGDTDQLPSVGAGCVLRDIIDSHVVPTIRLTEIYRQAQGSDIIMNAHRINQGKMPLMDNHEGTDFYLFKSEDKERVAELIVELVTRRIPNKFGFRPEDIQVLTPMRRDWDPIGSIQLNARLQQAVNTTGRKVAGRPDGEFRIGDRIMVTRNNYEKEVFNGDIGTVTAKLSGEDDDEAVMQTSFDGRTVRFTQQDLDDIELAYACTIHKSQGSEYPAVIIPVHTSQFVMLKRNLLYTGITRAKKLCVLVGTPKAVGMAVSRPDTTVRKTRLRTRIHEEIDND